MEMEDFPTADQPPMFIAFEKVDGGYWVTGVVYDPKDNEFDQFKAVDSTIDGALVRLRRVMEGWNELGPEDSQTIEDKAREEAKRLK